MKTKKGEPKRAIHNPVFVKTENWHLLKDWLKKASNTYPLYRNWVLLVFLLLADKFDKSFSMFYNTDNQIMEDEFMISITNCEYNIDTASVEVTFSDGSMLSIYSHAVDDALDLSMSQQADLDWLMYNKPLEYAQLILSEEVMDYFKYSPMRGFKWVQRIETY